MGMNLTTYQIVNEFNRLDEVVAITLAGSGASGRNDFYSDIDIDIIVSGEISPEKRRKIIKKFADSMEINNKFFCTSDEFILRNSTIQIDITYLPISWINDNLTDILNKCNGRMGYSTVIWDKVINSMVVYDRDDEFKKLQEKYRVKYPKKLKESIIEKNYPMLRKSFSSYFNQVEKAIVRRDIVSINHRITAFLDSYFDIIFALNEIPHPGEKRLLSIIQHKCNLKPLNYNEDINGLIESIADYSDRTLVIMNELVDNLDKIIQKVDVI